MTASVVVCIRCVLVLRLLSVWGICCRLCGFAGCTVVSGLAFWVFDWVFRSLVSLVLGGSY